MIYFIMQKVLEMFKCIHIKQSNIIEKKYIYCQIFSHIALFYIHNNLFYRKYNNIQYVQ